MAGCPGAGLTPGRSTLPALGPAPTLLHQDARLWVVDKPPGLLVHRTALDAHESDCLVSRWTALTGERPLAVHRLDKGTSGVIVLARDAAAAASLGQAFEQGRVHKTYLALVRGWPADSGRIDHALARDPEQASAGQPRREALTEWRCLDRFEWPFSVDGRHPGSRYALVEARPLTGRRHQIRRHFKHIGHPLLGDSTHGKGPHNRAVAAWLGVQRLWLHALAVELPHPDDGRPLRVRADPGPEWAPLLRRSSPPPSAR